MAKVRASKRGPASLVERHPNFAEIRLGLANGLTLDALAARYGISRDSLHRYRRSMTAEDIARLRYRREESPLDLERLRRGEAQAIVARNIDMLAELRQLFTLCLKSEDFRTAASVAREYRGFVELQARIVGELKAAGATVNFNIASHPTYQRLVAIVLAWAAPHPELSVELAGFLEQQEQAEAIEAAKMIPPGADDASGAFN